MLAAKKDIPYVEAYGQGYFDGQGSGHDFYGVSPCLLTAQIHHPHD